MGANGRSYGAVVLDPPKLIASRLDISPCKRKYFDLKRAGDGVGRARRPVADLFVLRVLPEADFRHLAARRGSAGGPLCARFSR